MTTDRSTTNDRDSFDSPGPATRRSWLAGAGALAGFIRMYRPHEAREETVLFPALREIVAGKDLDALGERFEEREHRLFGDRGFEGMVQRVAGIEKALGIDDLGKFTPRA